MHHARDAQGTQSRNYSANENRYPRNTRTQKNIKRRIDRRVRQASTSFCLHLGAMAVEIGKSSAVNLSPPDEVENGKPDERGRSDGQSTFGELDFNEYTQGGLGRHLGVFSTIFLMFVSFAFSSLVESAN